jgi:hypothetical protein
VTKATSDEPTIGIIVGGQCCGDGYDLADLVAIRDVVTKSISAFKAGKHGTIDCTSEGQAIASVYIDRGEGFEFSEDEGLPVIATVTRKETA